MFSILDQHRHQVKPDQHIERFKTYTVGYKTTYDILQRCGNIWVPIYVYMYVCMYCIYIYIYIVWKMCYIHFEGSEVSPPNIHHFGEMSSIFGAFDAPRIWFADDDDSLPSELGPAMLRARGISATNAAGLESCDRKQRNWFGDRFCWQSKVAGKCQKNEW